MVDENWLKYRQQKYGAAHRGIEFTLTYEQWLEVWGDKIANRGTGADQLGMLRRRDEGGYTYGNVYIGTPKQNNHEKVVAMRVRKAQAPPPPPAYRPKPPVPGSWLQRNNVFKEYSEEEEEGY